jgi:hypothetical protein
MLAYLLLAKDSVDEKFSTGVVLKGLPRRDSFARRHAAASELFSIKKRRN